MRIRRYRSTPLGFRSTTERTSKKNLGHLVRYSVTKSKAKTWAALFRIKVFSGWGFSIWQREIVHEIKYKSESLKHAILLFIINRQKLTKPQHGLDQLCNNCARKLPKYLSAYPDGKQTNVLCLLLILTLLKKSFTCRILLVFGSTKLFFFYLLYKENNNSSYITILYVKVKINKKEHNVKKNSNDSLVKGSPLGVNKNLFLSSS